MSEHDTPPDAKRLTRRGLLLAGTAAAAVRLAPPVAAAQAPERPAEWRNRQAGMAYRRLGRTGMMISEVVAGGDPITLRNFRQLEQAVEMGLNYLDMAPQYNGGDTERAIGELLRSSSVKRDGVFLTTKVSGYSQLRERKYQEIFRSLPASKQEALQQRARELREERGVESPGYFLTYFPGQSGQFDSAYLRVAMMPEFGEQVEGSPELRRYLVDSLEGSLQRVGTDHFDILMCPHGAATPEELEGPYILDTFQTLWQQGKVRFLGVSAHNDPAGVLVTAARLGHYDVVMMAYNVINGGYVDRSIREAHAKGVGMIAMKAAHAVATHHRALQPVPDWRVQKIHRIMPGEGKAPVKAYLWALQNPRISAVISNLWDAEHVRENLAIAGKKVDLQPA